MKSFMLKMLLLLLLPVCAFAQEQPPAKVVLSPISHEKLAENQSFLGVLYYDRIGHVSSDVSGLVQKMDVQEGDKVNEGDVLLELDTEILDMDIVLHRTRIDQIALRIEHAQKNYKRLDTLFTAEGVSEKDYEEALYTYQDLEKEKQAAEDSLQKLLIQKRKSIIKAPFSGIILEKNIDKGDWVQQGKSLVTLGSSSDLFVRVPVAETLLKFAHKGDEVPVILTAFDRELTGIIEDFVPTADAKTKNIFLKIRIPPQVKVAQNMSAQVFLPTSEVKELAIIPRDALIKFQGGDFVYTVKDDKAAIMPVNIVTYRGSYVAADNPYFTPGMPVVVEGNERLRPDQAVEITGEK